MAVSCVAAGAGATCPKTSGCSARANLSIRSGVQSVVLLVLGMAVMRLRDQGCHNGGVIQGCAFQRMEGGWKVLWKAESLSGSEKLPTFQPSRKYRPP